ncbi:hypothetical protein V8G54_030903 [Vigna mungo]|uniref:Uncharacterized protein n=1 Tax=Vigna mungo TaxID=3915 RepID=A0AAQ3MXB5_VIGMU
MFNEVMEPVLVERITNFSPMRSRWVKARQNGNALLRHQCGQTNLMVDQRVLVAPTHQHAPPQLPHPLQNHAAIATTRIAILVLAVNPNGQRQLPQHVTHVGRQNRILRKPHLRRNPLCGPEKRLTQYQPSDLKRLQVINPIRVSFGRHT